MMYDIDPAKEPEKMTYNRVRGFLKDIKYSHFYENISQIIERLTGTKTKRFSMKQRSALTLRFKELQEPFERHRGNRKNFLSYSYTIYKLCELLGMDEFLGRLPLLKAHKNLLAADHIWEKICIDLGYEYIPTA
jgi:hypothetical protein